MAAFLLCLVSLLGMVHSKIHLAPLFADHMMFQEGKRSTVWGLTDAPNVEVTVSFLTHTYKSTSNRDRFWSITIEPPQLQSGPNNMTLSTTTDELTLTDILIGDVFLCSGQSNMEISVSGSLYAAKEIAAANYPDIRIVQNANLPAFHNITTPQRHAYVSIPWGPVTPKRIPRFSGHCYFFGRDVYQTLTNRSHHKPIGLIQSCWGGTPIEAWSSPRSLAKCHIPPENPSCVKTPGPSCHSTLYNAMINPWRPLALKGFVWDQGEANIARPQAYECELPSMAENWRKMWNDNTLPFVYRQLHSYPAGGQLGNMRYGMSIAKNGNTDWMGMVTSYDLGYLNSTDGNIHFMNKEEIGRRSHLAMMNLAYEYTDIVFGGPVAKSVKVIDYGKGGLKYFCGEVEFDGVSAANPLRLNNGWPPYCGVEMKLGRGGGAWPDSQWTPVVVTLHGPNKIWFNFTLDGQEADKPPTHVRYAWFDIAFSSLFDTKWNLPAQPFNLTIPQPADWE
eukprot:TRINITY_DN62927_c0_g1_i1.p1 TRINITY_DN62927_c0_g1~~TRINITY_DN62927_c0_g1_i1.p1  ORF type:complete len:512 (-),score=20.91 TRINITY_DN62927_c0_g1_i1:28-1539(-)